MTGFDDQGHITESVEFDYDVIDQRLAGEFSPDAAQHQNSHEASLVPLQKMAQWIVQTVPKNQDGIEIRAVIVAWKFLPYLRGKSLTEIAAMIGRDKQSVGRWHDDFKRRFERAQTRGGEFRAGEFKAGK